MLLQAAVNLLVRLPSLVRRSTYARIGLTALRRAKETARIPSAAPDCALGIAVAFSARTARVPFSAADGSTFLAIDGQPGPPGLRFRDRATPGQVLLDGCRLLQRPSEAGDRGDSAHNSVLVGGPGIGRTIRPQRSVCRHLSIIVTVCTSSPLFSSSTRLNKRSSWASPNSSQHDLCMPLVVLNEPGYRRMRAALGRQQVFISER
jgi:hypothetical protein